jgi:DNA-binding NtrC family response regulator
VDISADILQTARLDRAGGTELLLEFEALQLVVIEGPDAGRKVSRGLARLRVGTAEDNDLVLRDEAVSRYHLEVFEAGEELAVRDLGSTNGTRVGGVKVTEAPLELPARIQLGDTVLEVKRRTKQARGQVQDDDGSLEELVGASPPMRELYGLIRTVAPTDVTLLLTGETGTGKELVARAIHARSGRGGPLVVYDCATADPEMIRADLLGHAKGAFTGAASDRPGAAREAHGGTLFLDEIGELPLEIQPRLLRLLERREVIPVGTDKAVPVDVRVVAATHRDLAAMVAEGTFREDLYHRLAVIPVRVPSLRERPTDLSELVRHLLASRKLAADLGPEALATMKSYPWPGNVRQLRNVLERVAILCSGRPVQPADLGLPPAHGGAAPVATAGPMGSPWAGRTIEDVERDMIEDAMRRHDDDKLAVAAELGISIGTLRRRLKAYSSGGSSSET